MNVIKSSYQWVDVFKKNWNEFLSDQFIGYFYSYAMTSVETYWKPFNRPLGKRFAFNYSTYSLSQVKIK